MLVFGCVLDKVSTTPISWRSMGRRPYGPMGDRLHPAETSKNSDICDFLKVSDIWWAL